MHAPVIAYKVEIQFSNFTKHLVYLYTLSDVFMLSSTWP